MATPVIRVLYADDDPALSRLILRRLTEHGYAASWAAHGQEALDLASREPFDLVALDYRMPRLNGLEVLERLRAQGMTMPVVLISGVSDMSVPVRALQLGASDYVIKDEAGAYLDLLPASIARQVETRRLQHEAEAAQAAMAEQSRLLKATLDSIKEGLCVFGPDLRLIEWNQRYLDLYDFPGSLGRAGTPLESFLRYNAERGEYGGGDVDALVAARLARAAQTEPHAYEHVRPDGTVIEVRGCPMPHGGFVSTHTDISERKRLELRLRSTVAEQKVLLENSLVGIALVVGDRLVQVNPKLAEIFGYDRAEMVGGRVADLLPGLELTPCERARPVLAKGDAFEAEIGTWRKDGRAIWCHLQARAIEPPDLEKGVICNVEDVTQRREAQERQRLAAAVFHHAGEGIMITDAENRIQVVNPAFTRITGFDETEAQGRALSFFAAERHDDAFFGDMQRQLDATGQWEGELWNRRKDGALFAERLSIAAVSDGAGKAQHHVGIFHDITHRKEDEEQAWHRANYDALTGLPNRALLLDRLEQSCSRAGREGGGFAVLFIDLDGFKAVNDRLGHAVGDELLQQAAARLRTCVRASDTVARLGGDEFVAVLDGADQMERCRGVADKMLITLGNAFRFDRAEVFVSASIGIAVYGRNGTAVHALLDAADAAMYAAKRGGKNAWRFAVDAAPCEA